MDFNTALYNIMEFIYLTFIDPLDILFHEQGFSSIPFSFDATMNFSGFLGISQLPDISINDLLLLIIGFTVSITALMLLIKFVKFLTGFLKSLFTGIKR